MVQSALSRRKHFVFLLTNFQIQIDFNVFRDGRSRCGIYCAANACIEQVIQHGEVDIFQAVRTVRRHRPQLIENIVSITEIRQPTYNYKLVFFVADRI